MLASILRRAGLFAAILTISALPARADGDADKGKRLFARCQACHTLEEGQNRVGPTLAGIFGREAGTLAGFPRYSKAMKESGIVWDEETIDAYLGDPRGYIPGNIMAFPGLPREEDREDLIAFLRQATGDGED